MDDTNVFAVQCLPTLFFFFPASAVLLTGTFDFFIALGILALKTLTFYCVDTQQHQVCHNGETGGYYFCAFQQLQSNSRFLFTHQIVQKNRF